jgi:hypothetical protein
MDIDSSYNEASNAQRSDEGQSQPPETNTAATMQLMMQQMMQQMSELMARVEKIETKETTAANAAPTIPTPIITPAANTNYKPPSSHKY